MTGFNEHIQALRQAICIKDGIEELMSLNCFYLYSWHFRVSGPSLSGHYEQRSPAPNMAKKFSCCYRELHLAFVLAIDQL